LSCLLADVRILGNAAHGIGIETGVEVHRDLDEEDDGEDGPFLPGGKGEAKFIAAVVL
jgi:hypothetical protein